MRYIHKTCGTPISYVKKCHTCDTEVEWEEISRGYEYEKGKFVLFEKEELEQLADETGKEIEIVDFVNLNEIDPIYFQKTYYLAPGDTGANAYSLLRKAMERTQRIAIAKVTIRSKTTLAALRIYKNCITMETIFYPDEIRDVSQVPNLPENTEVKEQELNMAEMLIDHLTRPFDPEKFTDDYRNRLLEAIEQKVAGEEVKIAPQKEEASIVDLMSALQASLEKAQAQAPGKKPKTDKETKATVS